jgi:acyl-CoA synthetase (NDP forming)
MKPDFEQLFKPRSVAVIGASDNPNKLGFHVMRSLLEGGYSGSVLPVNPGKKSILGLPTCPAISRASGPLDMAVVVLPAAQVPSQIKTCAASGVKSVVLITAGFKEIEDPSGAALEKEVSLLANEAGIPIIGPNTFGLVNLHLPLNASFTPEFSRCEKGGVTLISQSGGISHLIGFLAMRDRVGFSKIVGLGNRCNVDFPEMIAWLCEDPETAVIALYVEGTDDPRALLTAVNRCRGRKPVVVYKVGNSAVADLASLSHTGSLAGRHEIYQGACRQAGLISVPSAGDLLDASKALAVCPFPDGPNIAILSGQAGPAMAASDVCQRAGLHLVPFAAQTQNKINALLPPLALRTNPVDMGPAWYDPSAIKGILEAVLLDVHIHGILLFIMFASANAGALKGLAASLSKNNLAKPIISCIVAPPGIWEEDIRQLEKEGGLVNYATPERAAKVMSYLVEARRLMFRK